MKIFYNRRIFLARIIALMALPLATVRRARAQSDPLEAMLNRLAGGAPVRSGRVKLVIPVLADNGNSVSLSVAVESPMSVADHVKSIHLIAPKNPRPQVASFFFGPGAGRAQISTRIRLSGSQGVVAVAAMSDGSYWSATAEVAVTVSACWDAS